jgi:hypothetical protein
MSLHSTTQQGDICETFWGPGITPASFLYVFTQLQTPRLSESAVLCLLAYNDDTFTDQETYANLFAHLLEETGFGYFQHS